MGRVGNPLSPTSSLPPLRQLDKLLEPQITSALDNLCAIYHPGAVLQSEVVYAAAKPGKLRSRIAPLTDSGYNSGYTSENEDDAEDEPDLTTLRADRFERTFAIRWLQNFVVAAEDELATCFETDQSRQLAMDRAADLLTSLLVGSVENEKGEQVGEEDDKFSREFSFALPGCGDGTNVAVRLNDGLAGHRSEDHTDVGLQTWGASIVLCQLLCSSPGRFGVTRESLRSSPRIVELGAGTGLVSLVLGKLLSGFGVNYPAIVATDYHPTVIANLVDNIATNFPVNGDNGMAPVRACALDWAETTLGPEWPLGDARADMLFATDVVYEPEHASMLYDCASRLLASTGVFWLLATVRTNGRFNAVGDTVEAVFGERSRTQVERTGKVLTVLGSERLEKSSGVGRGDETFYKLFRIGWA